MTMRVDLTARGDLKFSEALLAAGERFTPGDAEKLRETIEKLLATPTTDPQLVPLAEELMKLLRSTVAGSEDRYHDPAGVGRTAEKPTEFFIAPPNLPFTVRASS